MAESGAADFEGVILIRYGFFSPFFMGGVAEIWLSLWNSNENQCFKVLFIIRDIQYTLGMPKCI